MPDSLFSKQFKSNLPLFLQRRIQFREAAMDESSHSAMFKYQTGNNKRSLSSASSKERTLLSTTKESGDGFQGPKKELFPAERIRTMLKWHQVRAIGPGLINLGNTCFLNSVLQCLTYTPPLANYLLSGEHGRKCRLEGFCLMCELERHIGLALGSVSSTTGTETSGNNINPRQRCIQPTGTVGHLRLIAKHMRVGRQEDSHEFLRFLVEYLQKNLLAAISKSTSLDVRTKETTIVHQIFGGYLQSQVHCLTCHHNSHTYDPFLDLSLDVRQADSVTKALHYFTQTDRLTQANRYRCEKCGCLSEAEKSMSIFRTPNVLTVHLKRFNMNAWGEMSKINKHVEFAPHLDISPYLAVSDRNNTVDSTFELYAVLVHEGQSCNSGHYHAFVKASNGIWYSMNDSSVTQVSLATVLKQRAYLLFYVRNLDDVETKPSDEDKVAEIATPNPIPIPILIQSAIDYHHQDESFRHLPTPPATPDPELSPLPTRKKAKVDIKDTMTSMSNEVQVISSSMWYLSELDNFRVEDFAGLCRRIFPASKWIIRLLLDSK